MSSALAPGITASRHRISGRETELLDGFHTALADLMPDAALLRLPAGHRVSQLLVQSVLWVIDTRDPVEDVHRSLFDVGAEVRRLGFPDEGYQAVGHALLRAVRSVHPGDWSGVLSSQWVGLYDELRTFWLRGAVAVRTGVAAAPEQTLLPPGDAVELDEDDEDDEDDPGDEPELAAATPPRGIQRG